MKKTSFKALLAGAPQRAPRSNQLTEDVNEILNKVAKEDKLVALARHRVGPTLPDDDQTADHLLRLLKKGLRAVE